MSDEPTQTASPTVDADQLTQPGLHEVTSDDPAQTAQALADELSGELVASADLEATIARRRSDDPAAAAALLAQRAAAGPADRVRVVADIDALGMMASGLAKADRIVAGTEANMVETVGQRVSGGGISVHPDSIRAAANELVLARAEVVATAGELDVLNDSAMDVLIESHADERQAAAETTEVEDPRAAGKLGKSAKRRIAGVLLMAIGVAVVLGALLAVAAGPLAAIVLVVPAIAGWWAYSTARHDISDLDDKDTASDNLAQISARTDEVFGSAPAEAEEQEPGGIPASVGAQLRRVESQLELARERERGASANWIELGGGEADPSDVDRVLRERDPQYFAAIDMVGQTSQARAAVGHLRRVRARWNLAWAVLGEEAPHAADAEDAVRQLATTGVRAVKINTRVGTDDDRELAQRSLDDLTATTATGPMVLTGLSEDLSDEIIDALADLANSTAIVLVSAPSA